MAAITVLIATYKRERFLGQALQSLVRQDFTDWEAIVVNNGQCAATEEVVGRFRDSRIRRVRVRDNLGECGGRNLAVAHATGELLCYLDDDDLLPDDSLSIRFEFARQHPECGMIYGEYRLSYLEKGRWRKPPQPTPPYMRKRYYDSLLARLEYEPEGTYQLLKWFNFVRGGTPLIRRVALDAIGPFDPCFSVYGDYDFWLRMAHRYPMRFLDYVVYEYRLHPESTTRRAADSDWERKMALMLCYKHSIRRSVQFARHSQDIDRLWEAHACGARTGDRTIDGILTENSHW